MTVDSSIESDFAALATPLELPVEAIGACLLRYDEAGPLLRASLLRAADGKITDEEEALQFFRGLFIIGGHRDKLAFEPLLRLLRRPYEELDWLLGDAITDALPQIVAGVFDGNSNMLFDAIVDLQLDQFVREALLGAATFLTWEGRIERAQMTGFLRRFEAERLAPDGDEAWYGWMTAIALLGLRDLVPAVDAAFDREALSDYVISREEFREMLERADREPDDIARFKDQKLGYIADVVEALERYPAASDDELDELDELDEPDDWPIEPHIESTPVINPFRHVGRNDPCPCGSGKKAKRCCLAA